MLLVNKTLNVRLLRSVYLNITRVHNELQVVMQETNFMQFAETQTFVVADESSSGKHTFHSIYTGSGVNLVRSLEGRESGPRNFQFESKKFQIFRKISDFFG